MTLTTASAPLSPHPARVVVFGHNRNDTSLVRRAHMFINAGASVTLFTFRRDGATVASSTEWQDVDLGHIEHKRFVSRMFMYLRTLPVLYRHRRELRDANVVYARNLDVYALMRIALMIFAPERLSQGNRRRVYECIDIHHSLTQASLIAASLRALERRVLTDAHLLVTSSEAFVRNYFKPVQRFDTPWILIENKLPINGVPVSREPDGVASFPFVLVWAGILRCPSTLKLLIEAAKRLPESLIVRICGRVSLFIIPDFHERIAGISNIEFSGVYEYPTGLSEVYEGASACWSQELGMLNGNSNWLIPNRVYEASMFSVPSIAVRGTETARFVEERDLGIVLKDYRVETLVEFIETHNSESLSSLRAELFKRPRSDFVESYEDGQRLLYECQTASRVLA